MLGVDKDVRREVANLSKRLGINKKTWVYVSIGLRTPFNETVDRRILHLRDVTIHSVGLVSVISLGLRLSRMMGLELLGENLDEFHDRYVTMLLKKNMSLEVGFQGPFGMLWTQQAYHRRFIRPGYEPVWEFFGVLAKEGEDGRSVLNKLKEKFDADLIHDSLVDLYAVDCPHGWPSDLKRRLIDEMLTLLHTVEGVPSCKEWDCTWYRNQKYGTPSASGKTFESGPS
jgi:hypothetical protein